MQLLIALILCASLMAVLTWWLHTTQQRKSREDADQGAPLPPPPDADIPDQQPANAGLQVARELSPAHTSAGSWRDEVKSLRDAGQFQEALSLCSRQYPKMLAFRQTMITLRSQLKTSEQEPESALKDIYRTALLAGAARESRGTDTAGNDLLAQLPDLEAPETYWHDIGYRHLDLLSKTDRHLLIKHWGEPSKHNKINILLDQNPSN